MVIENFRKEAIAVRALTGAVAINISGSAIHSQFSLPLNPLIFSKLYNEPLRRFQMKNQHLEFNVVDEMSMIGARMLYHIEIRCSDMYSDNEKNVGGLFV